MLSPDLQAEFLDLEMLEQIDICPKQLLEFEEMKGEQDDDSQTPLPF